VGLADTDVARHILEKRYYRGNEKDPFSLAKRVADTMAIPEDDEAHWSAEFYELIIDGKFLPNSPAIVNAGYGGGLFACFVIGMEDDLNSISQAKADAMAITKHGGGWGIGLSALRPRGSKVGGSTHGIAGGPVAFWETFSHDMRTMTQGGFRDAACMATMSVHHPDIMEFIYAKSPINSVIKLMNLEDVTTDPYLAARALLNNDVVQAASETYMSNFNISVLATHEFMKRAIEGGDIILGHIKSEDVVMTDASKLLDSIVAGAWENGEPGLLFIDTIRARTKYEPYKIVATNPCGEQPLPPNGSCCLGSINVSMHLNEDDTNFDWDSLERTVKAAVRFLDNMITLNKFPTEKTKEWSHHHRSIGLGIMGWADALVMLGIRYDSEEAVELANDLAYNIYSFASIASEELLDEKGGHSWDGHRNHVLLSIAPTGTISLLAGCSAGIEPIFSETISRTDTTGSYLIDHPLAQYDSFVALSDIDPRWIIRHVSTFSRYVDSSISYTVNVPTDTTRDEVRELIIYAWEKECNGITIYRDGSRVRQVLSDTSLSGEEEQSIRPHWLDGRTFKYQALIGDQRQNVYVTVNRHGDSLYELFVHTPYIKSMNELREVTTATRLVSLALKWGVPPDAIIKQLDRVEGQSLHNVQRAIAKAIREMLGDGEKCSNCGGVYVYTGGCGVCLDCGHSSCG